MVILSFRNLMNHSSNDLLDFWELFDFLNKDEFIEFLSDYHQVKGKKLITLKEENNILFKISVYEIYNYDNVSNYCKKFIYNTFIKGWEQNKVKNNYIDYILEELKNYQ